METTELSTLAHLSLGEIVIQYPGARAVLDEHQLDYCCGGKMDLETACEAQQLDMNNIVAYILKPAGPDSLPLRYHQWSTSLLIDFIEQNYHQYVRQSIPVLRELLTKIAAVHGDEHPELHFVRDEFEVLADDLLSHMKKEEIVLFPALRELEQTGGQSDNPIAIMVDHPIAAMEHEHDVAGEILKSIRSHTLQYTVPKGGCVTYELAFRQLAEFDKELVNHIHLENNVLFKKRY